MNRKIFALLGTILFAVSALLAGCGGGGGQAKKEDSTPYKLKVGYSMSACQSSIISAYENGYFKEEGIDVELVQVDAAHVSDAVGAGKIEVFQGLVAKLVQPLEHGLPAHITGGLHTGCQRLLVRKDSPINSVADLKGKKIGVAGLVDAGCIITKRALAAAGVDVRDKSLEVEFAVYSRNDLVQALEKGLVDAVAVGDPVGAIAVEKYGWKTLIDTAKTKPYADEYCCVSLASDKLLKERPDIAEKATRAILRGALWTQKHPDLAVKQMLDKKYTSGNQQLNESLVRSYSFIPSVQGGYDALKANAVELEKIGLIKKGTDGKKFADAHFFFFKNFADKPADDSVK